MRRQVRLLVGAIIMIALPLLALPFLGWEAIAISGFLLVVIVVGYGWSRRGRGLGAGMVILGGLVGVVNASSALITVGGNPAYRSRIGFGWAALVLAALAGLSPFLRDRHRLLAAAIAIIAGSGGAVAIEGFYINTFYLVALVFWLPGAMVMLASGGRTNDTARSS